MRSTLWILASAFGFVLVNATASLGSSPESASVDSPALGSEQGARQVVPMACCMVCTNGKACGNSCISKSKDCHQPPGCACDG